MQVGRDASAAKSLMQLHWCAKVGASPYVDETELLGGYVTVSDHPVACVAGNDDPEQLTIRPKLGMRGP